MNNLLNFLKYGQSHVSRSLSALLPCLLCLSGCAPAPVSSPLPKKDALITVPFMQNEQTGQITELYQHPATAPSAEENQLRLQAIDSLIQAGDGTAAKQAADAIDPSTLSPHQRTQLSLLYAQILLSLGEAELAIERLALIQPQQLSLDNQIKYFQSQAFAFSLVGNPLNSAKSRIDLHPLLSSPDQLRENQAAILETLNLALDSDFHNNQQSSTDTLAGWISLAKILKLKDHNIADFNAEIAQWRATFPEHPANLAFLEQTQETSGNASLQPKSVAIFLPESGSFAQAGKAIRAGFMAAYNHSGSNSFKPRIHFYDSEQSPPRALYNQAVAEGAELIIGPLSKEHIQSLAESVKFTTPVFALNHIPGLQKDNLYQFGLSPIDDVEQITSKAQADGHQQALLLIPENAQGKRIADYFKESWQGLNGTILETQTYNPKETDFSSPIKKLLNLDESEQRYNKILSIIPSAKYIPRRRQDADALFLSAYSAEARSINPQLQFYQAGSIPVYAMPNVYAGLVNASLDADLN
ncbi:MAG: penicillin-binding protein activator, partial [Methylobacter sp.]|nr:penicillin-binding protein activator [Methylobacter sp.]